MEQKSLHGLAKGTQFETMSAMLAQGEAKGTMMYYALARLAREQGMPEVAEKFIEAAVQEANHAGFFATLNGLYPKDFWALVNGLQKAEAAGETAFKKLAERFKAAGLDDAAKEIEIFAAQEGHHGVLLQEILDKYQKNIDTTGKTVYVCGCCGYEYVGDIDAEGDDYVCPVCGMPRKVFRQKGDK